MAEIARPFARAAKRFARFVGPSAALVLIHLAFFGIRFETNDDLGMALAFRGYLSLNGEPLWNFFPMPYLNGWSYLFVFLYRLMPTVSWYGWSLLAGTTVSLAFSSAALRSFLMPLRLSFFAPLIVYGLYFPNIDNTSFTRVSELLIGSAIVFVYALGLQGKLDRRFTWWLPVLALACYGLRTHSALATLVTIGTACFFLIDGAARWQFARRILAPSFLVIGLAVAYSQIWKSPRASVINLAAHIVDYESCTQLANQSEANRILSTAFMLRFIADRDLLDEPRAKALASDMNCGTETVVREDYLSRARWFRSYLRGHTPDFFLLCFFISLIAAWRFRKKSIELVAAFAVLFGALGCSALLFKIEDRVFQPLLAEAILAGLIWLLHHDQTKLEDKTYQRLTLTLIAAMGIFPLAFGVTTRLPWSVTQKEVETVAERLRSVDLARARHPLIVSSGARKLLILNRMPLFSERMYRMSPDLLPMSFLGSWMFHSNSYDELVKRVGGTGKYIDFFKVIVERPESRLLAPTNETTFLSDYFRVFYERTLSTDSEPDLDHTGFAPETELHFWKPHFD